VSAATPATDAPLGLPVETFALTNGLRVVLAPDASRTSVAVQVRYAVGARSDPEGQSGLAHLTEHMMFEGSRHVPRGAFLQQLADAGASTLNGQTMPDQTVYLETLPPEKLELALWLESDRMGFFLDALDEDTFAQQRKVVWTEQRTRMADRTGGVAEGQLYLATFPSWHPYHFQMAGNPDEIGRLSVDDVRAFYSTWYAPSNAWVVICGRFDPARAKELVRRYFESLADHRVPTQPALPKLERKGTTRIELEERNDEDSVILSWVTPAFGTREDAALDWVAAILASGSTSRLSTSLQGLTRTVSASHTSLDLASVLTIRASGLPGHRADEIRDAIDDELTRVATSGPLDSELARARTTWRDNDLFRLESATSRAELLVSATRLGAFKSPFDWSSTRVRDFTADEIRGVVSAYLRPQARAAELLTRANREAPLAGVVIRRSGP
jgi:predicted Zn-dependent peptidase